MSECVPMKCKKPTLEHVGFVACAAVILQHRYVFSTWAFGTLAFGERYSLAFSQLIKADAIDLGGVEKQILGFPSVDKTEAFIRKLLDRSF